MCTCGGNTNSACSHIRAVVAYLESGGERASPGEPFRDCPVCGASITWDKRRYGFSSTWSCTVGGGSHFLEWLAKTVHSGKVEKFLTGDWEGKWHQK